jgi:hypothetical protein
MKLALIVVTSIAWALPAAAQPTAETGAFLQQRVVEELASDGVVLSRLGVSIQIEFVGDQVLVSLVDNTTHRPSASTKIEALPADREAAVAVVTQVAAGLAVQLGAQPLKPPSTTLRDDSRAREAAELAFRREAIGFGTELFVTVNEDKYGTTVTTNSRWYANQGELKVRLDGPTFYRLIERPDLASAYETRRTWKYATGIVSLAALGAGIYSIITWGNGQVNLDYTGCGDFDFDCRRAAEARAEERAAPYATAAAVFIVGGLVTGGIASYLHLNPHPISEAKAKSLAAQHNDKLRKRLGLPTATDVTVAPFATPDGGGLTIAGRF